MSCTGEHNNNIMFLSSVVCSYSSVIFISNIVIVYVASTYISKWVILKILYHSSIAAA